jgi:hypothetical protein
MSDTVLQTLISVWFRQGEKALQPCACCPTPRKPVEPSILQSASLFSSFCGFSRSSKR